jgi:CDP-L-myo-inositol myo-inositolphosphotransferase
MQAVILAAGQGKRLTDKGQVPKPLVLLLGLTLLERSILSCRNAGIEEFIVVLGHRSEEISPLLNEWEKRYRVTISPVENRSWEQGNGTSALAAHDHVSGRFLLLMADHVFDPGAIPKLIAAGGGSSSCWLLVDPRLQYETDPDFTRVRLDDDRITEIGKGISPYDAIDTGIFLCGEALFAALAQSTEAGDGSLTGGIRRLATAGQMRAVDIGPHYWMDVDTRPRLKQAERKLIKDLPKPHEDGFIATFINRPLSVRLSAAIARRPSLSHRLTPNALSLVSLLVILAGAGLFAVTGYTGTLIAGILIQSGSILDGCDGELARLTFRKSRFGAWLDTIFDRYGDIAVSTMITYAGWQRHPSPWIWIGGIIAMSGLFLAGYTKKEHQLRYKKPLPNTGWAKLVKRDLRLFMLFIGAVAGQPYYALLAMGLLSHIGVWRLFREGLRLRGR